MDSNFENPVIAATCATLCLASTLFATIIGNIEVLARIGSYLFAMASGFFAVRYYYYATKEKKQNLKQ